ncbi:MAG: hypothetical protein V1492_06105 [Candidatus Micrarchaeota archaeon]
MALTQAKATEVENLLNKMKEAGIGGGLLQKDGVVVKATVALGDTAPTLLTRVVNASDAMLQREGNTQKEVEITFGGETIVIVPMATYLFFGIAKTKEEKRAILDFSKQAESVL